MLAFLMLGAHFFRGAQVLPAAACIAAAGLSFVRRPALTLILRLALVAGAALWIFTAWRIGHDRVAAGEPYLRMALILGGVAVFTAVSAWMLPAARPATAPPRE